MSDVREFQERVKKGDLESVKQALAAEPELLNAVNEAGQSSFLLAKYYRQPAMAAYLLSLGPQLDLFNQCVAGLTNQALAETDREPALLQVRNSDGWTPLHLAAFFGHPELAKGLLNRGAEVDARSTNAMENTALHAAAAGGNAALVELLLASGADVNAKQRGGWTALHSAAQTGNLEMAKVLLAHGADAQVRAENNQAPLDLALMQGKADMAEFLEALGAKLDNA